MFLLMFVHFCKVNPFSATRRDSRHQNKVKVKGLGTNSSYLAGFFIFFLWVYEEFQSVKNVILFNPFVSS